MHPLGTEGWLIGAGCLSIRGPTYDASNRGSEANQSVSHSSRSSRRGGTVARIRPAARRRELGIQVASDLVVPEVVREGEVSVPQGSAGDDDTETLPLLPRRPVDPRGKGPSSRASPLPAGDPIRDRPGWR